MVGNRADFGLEALVDLHGWTYEIGGGFWISITAVRVPTDHGRPHGISYSPTMHGADGERVLGYDNAHQPDVESGPARRSRRSGKARDHRHFRGHVTRYAFETPEKLIEDFWSDVQRILDEEGVTWTE
jgi:hypothetical protein